MRRSPGGARAPTPSGARPCGCDGDLRARGHARLVGDPLGAAALGAGVALAALLGAAGSLLSVAVPLAGVIAAAVAAVCLALEALGRTSPLRLLTRRRATQHVLALPTATSGCRC